MSLQLAGLPPLRLIRPWRASPRPHRWRTPPPPPGRPPARGAATSCTAPGIIPQEASNSAILQSDGNRHWAVSYHSAFVCSKMLEATCSAASSQMCERHPQCDALGCLR